MFLVIHHTQATCLRAWREFRYQQARRRCAGMMRESLTAKQIFVDFSSAVASFPPLNQDNVNINEVSNGWIYIFSIRRSRRWVSDRKSLVWVCDETDEHSSKSNKRKMCLIRSSYLFRSRSTYRSFASWKAEENIGTVSVRHLTKDIQKLRRVSWLEGEERKRVDTTSFKEISIKFSSNIVGTLLVK